jgi:UDP-N-acetylglucosamine:LPS N-acetylglucosamine transferase
VTAPAVVGPRRVLVLSAPVGEGHDAAGRAVVEQVREHGGAAEMRDGLALLGPRLARFVIRGYGLQVRHAAWSWAIVYALSRRRVVMRVAGCLLGLAGGRRLLHAIADARADVVVSTYPLVSAALASLRRRGRLPTPCASVITDFDPHPGWSHPDLDANLGVGSEAGLTQIAPPLRRATTDETAREARERLRIPLDRRVVMIAGGAWGVGNLADAAREVCELAGFHALVVTGRNAHLQRALSHELAGSPATVLGYVDGLASLIGAVDVVVQHAGGVTCLEAFAAQRPVIMFDPLPGHGKRNAARMETAGLAVTARSRRDLRELLQSDGYWRRSIASTVACGLALFERPAAEAVLARLVARHAPASRSFRVRPWPALGIALALALAILLGTQLGDPDLARWAFAP